MLTLTLNPGADRRSRQGHLWIFSNELRHPLPPLQAGEDVGIENAQGQRVGSGTFHPGSLIAVRIHDLGQGIPLDRDLLDRRIRSARDLRERTLGPDQAAYCRIVNAEGDFLPGLVVDRYGDLLAVQCLTAAMDRRTDWILDVLSDQFRPRGILLRNDASGRSLEGLEKQVSVGTGDVPDRTRVPLGPLRFSVDMKKGQKTGFYFDQRQNYELIRSLCPGKDVLDAFCYSGAWGLHAAAWGAASVTAVDSSETALDLARENAGENGLDRVTFQKSDVLPFLKSTAAEPPCYDLIILDPPAYTKSRKQAPDALKGHLNLHKWALRSIRPGGFLLTCCCSSYVEPDRFLDTIRLAAGSSGRRLRLIASRGQGVDHPWIPAMPETAYLKVHLLQCLLHGAD
jgi:23S rRNA (cytosine1962-C5)-methyltransferase